MFFKNKKKFDAKVRFQNRRFRNRLTEQRNYKRTQKKLPQTDWGVFLNKIGLGSWLSRSLTLFAFFGLVYLVYIPNFLFIKQVTITGLESGAKDRTEIQVNSFLDKHLPWPERNLLFLSKSKLTEYLLSNNSDILKINKIQKKFPNLLDITVEQRQNKFLLENSLGQFYSLSQDGIITGQVYPDASGTLPSNLFLIKLNKDAVFVQNQKPFKTEQFNFILNTSQRLPSVINGSLAEMNFDDLVDPYVLVKTNAGYDIKLDSTADLNKTLSRLAILIGQILPGDLKNTKYLDLRFAERAYTCMKSSDCANTTILPISTTTPTIISN